MMDTQISPLFWSVDQLISFGDDAIYDLAISASGTKTANNVLLGRCLLAVERTKLYEKLGTSGAIHFAVSILGLTGKEANTARRVARELESLPRLTRAAEQGRVAWSKLREVVSVASPDTEELWLELCGKLRWGQIQKLVGLTPKGGIPGDCEDPRGTHGEEYRCRFSPQVVAVIERVLQERSRVQGRPLSFAEAVEQLFTEALAGKPFDECAEKEREEARQELLAEQLAREPLVRLARELAESQGLLKSEESAEYDELESAELESTELESTELESTGSLASEPVSSRAGRDCQNEQVRDLLLSHLRFNSGQRHLTPAQRKALLRRDRHCCRTPGCPHSLWLHVHHIKWYCVDGKTLPENLITLCTRCHRNVHEGRLHVTILDDGELLFTDKAGRRLDIMHQIERAAWLDYHVGWRGDELESYRARVLKAIGLPPGHELNVA